MQVRNQESAGFILSTDMPTHTTFLLGTYMNIDDIKSSQVRKAMPTASAPVVIHISGAQVQSIT